jgi:hypothetical protein
MKNSIKLIVTLGLILVVTLGSCNPRKESRTTPIVNKLLFQEDLRSFRIPGFLVRYVMLVSEETRKIRPVLVGVNSFTISISEDLKDSQGVFMRINSELNSSNYTNIMEVIESTSRITIKALERNGLIREMVILIDDDSSFICLAIRGRIDPENFIKLVNNLANDKDFKKV